VDFDIRDQLLIRYSAFSRNWMKNENIMRQYISYLYTSKKPMTHKHLPDEFPIQNGPKQDAVSPLLFNFALEYAITKVLRKSGGIEIEWDTSPSGLW
jgi:hypothetical protein